MSEEQFELLQKAITLYSFAISQRGDDHEENDFFEMVEELSRIIGRELYMV